MMKKILTLTLCFMLSAALMAEQISLDRMLLEINGKSYSQKQMEIYVLLRTIAMGEKSLTGLPSADRWPQQLEVYKNEMIVASQVESESQRADSFAPDPKRLKAAIDAVAAVQGKEAEIDRYIRSRKLSDADLAQTLTQVFRVQAFLKSRMQLGNPQAGESDAFLVLDPASGWFQSLLRLTSFRFYEQAKSYKVIAPVKGL